MTGTSFWVPQRSQKIAKLYHRLIYEVQRDDLWVYKFSETVELTKLQKSKSSKFLRKTNVCARTIKFEKYEVSGLNQ